MYAEQRSRGQKNPGRLGSSSAAKRRYGSPWGSSLSYPGIHPSPERARNRFVREKVKVEKKGKLTWVPEIP